MGIEVSQRRLLSVPHESAAPLRVLYLMEALRIGGAERGFLRMARALDRERFQLAIGTLLPGGPLEPEIRALGIPIVPFARRGRFDLSPVSRLARYIRDERIDIVHGMHWLSNLFAELGAWRCPQTAVIGSTVGMVYDDSRHGQARLLLDRLCWRRMDVMTVNGAKLGTYLTERGFPAQRLRVVLNGVDVPNERLLTPETRAAARARLGVCADVPLVGIVARLDPVKDHPTFLRAAALLRERLPDAQFALVGGGPEQVALESLADSLGIREAVVFTGEVPDAAAYLPAFDVSVLCSRFEGLPTALLEAGSWALPLVSTPAGGATEVVVEGRTGLLAPIGDAERLAERVGELLADRARARTLGMAARAHVIERFSLAAMMAHFESIYETAALTRHGVRPRVPVAIPDPARSVIGDE